MLAGKLTRRIEIQRRTETRDSTGAVVWTWATWATCWASVQPLRGRELFDANQKMPLVSTQITIRYRPGITPKMRVLHPVEFGSPGRVRHYEIETALTVDERQRMIILYCQEIDAEGFAGVG